MAISKPLPNRCGSLSVRSIRTDKVNPSFQPISDVYSRINSGDRIILVDNQLVWANDRVRVDQDHLIYFANNPELDIMASIMG